MSRKAFEEFLSSHNEKSNDKEQAIDWGQQKEEWLAFVDTFYNSLEAWFKPYKDKGSLDYQYEPVQLTEDSIGTYQTRKMQVQFAQQNLQITPIGTLLIGTKGRIDMEGARGRVQFILADKNSQGPTAKYRFTYSISEEEPPADHSENKVDWSWKIVLKEAKRVSFVDFTEENFFDALMEIVNA